MKRLEGVLIALGALFLLASCASTSQFQHAKSGQVIEMKTYSVQAPDGEDWGFKIVKEKDSVTFLKPKPDVWDQLVGMSRGLAIFIDAGEAFRSFSSGDEAGDYIISAEENDLDQRGVKRGEFSLEEVKKGTVTIGNKKLYWMSYREIQKREDRIYEGIFYIYIPPEINENHLFYNFGMMKVHKRNVIGPGSALTGPDIAYIYHVIESFKHIKQK